MRRALAAVLLASIACSACDRGDRDVPEPYRSLAVPEGRLADAAARARGGAAFADACALCHGVRGDGAGVRRTGFAHPPRNLRDPAWRAGATPRRVFHVIREGVPGTGMPAWPQLDDDTTWDLVAYVLSLGTRPPSGEAP